MIGRGSVMARTDVELPLNPKKRLLSRPHHPSPKRRTKQSDLRGEQGDPLPTTTVTGAIAGGSVRHQSKRERDGLVDGCLRSRSSKDDGASGSVDELDRGAGDYGAPSKKEKRKALKAELAKLGQLIAKLETQEHRARSALDSSAGQSSQGNSDSRPNNGVQSSSIRGGEGFGGEAGGVGAVDEAKADMPPSASLDHRHGSSSQVGSHAADKSSQSSRGVSENRVSARAAAVAAAASAPVAAGNGVAVAAAGAQVQDDGNESFRKERRVVGSRMSVGTVEGEEVVGKTSAPLRRAVEGGRGGDGRLGRRGGVSVNNTTRGRMLSEASGAADLATGRPRALGFGATEAARDQERHRPEGQDVSRPRGAVGVPPQQSQVAEGRGSWGTGEGSGVTIPRGGGWRGNTAITPPASARDPKRKMDDVLTPRDAEDWEAKRQKIEGMREKRLSAIWKNCGNVLNHLMTTRSSWPFLVPVAVQWPGLLGYSEIIKDPIDFGTIKARMESGKYPHPNEFARECRLVFSNAMTFNAPGTEVYTMADSLRAKFEQKFGAIQSKIDEDAVKGKAEEEVLSLAKMRFIQQQRMQQQELEYVQSSRVLTGGQRGGGLGRGRGVLEVEGANRAAMVERDRASVLTKKEPASTVRVGGRGVEARLVNKGAGLAAQGNMKSRGGNNGPDSQQRMPIGASVRKDVPTTVERVIERTGRPVGDQPLVPGGLNVGPYAKVKSCDKGGKGRGKGEVLPVAVSKVDSAAERSEAYECKPQTSVVAAEAAEEESLKFPSLAVVGAGHSLPHRESEMSGNSRAGASPVKGVDMVKRGMDDGEERSEGSHRQRGEGGVVQRRGREREEARSVGMNGSIDGERRRGSQDDGGEDTRVERRPLVSAEVRNDENGIAERRGEGEGTDGTRGVEGEGQGGEGGGRGGVDNEEDEIITRSGDSRKCELDSRGAPNARGRQVEMNDVDVARDTRRAEGSRSTTSVRRAQSRERDVESKREAAGDEEERKDGRAGARLSQSHSMSQEKGAVDNTANRASVPALSERSYEVEGRDEARSSRSLSVSEAKDTMDNDNVKRPPGSPCSPERSYDVEGGGEAMGSGRSMKPSDEEHHREHERHRSSSREWRDDGEVTPKRATSASSPGRFGERTQQHKQHRSPSGNGRSSRGVPSPEYGPRSDIVTPRKGGGGGERSDDFTERKRRSGPSSSRRKRGSGNPLAYGGMRELTFKEKIKLSENIQTLPEDRLLKVVEIISSKNPNVAEGREEIELDINALDEETLWELFRLVNNWMKSKNKLMKSRSKPLRRPGMVEASLNSKGRRSDGGGAYYGARTGRDREEDAASTEDREDAASGAVEGDGGGRYGGDGMRKHENEEEDVDIDGEDDHLEVGRKSGAGSARGNMSPMPPRGGGNRSGADSGSESRSDSDDSDSDSSSGSTDSDGDSQGSSDSEDDNSDADPESKNQ